MSKILVVDDEMDLEVLIRQKFRKNVKSGQYDFVFATDGYDALDKLKQHPEIDLVLSDINMPKMDGLALLSRLNDIAPMTKTVMVSAYGDMDNIRTAMNKGAFDFVIKPVNFTDLELTMEKTLQHVEQMKTTLKSIKENNILKMYVNDGVLKYIGSTEYETTLTANETIEAAVVFIDICHFTAYCEKESPDRVVKMLNEYFEVIVNEILEQDGQIDKFMGDCVMALFKGENQLKRATTASLAIRDQISRMSTDEFPIYEVSIGINYGQMVSGNIGSTSLKRLDYTVIGDTVNLAQRLQSAAKPNQILVSENVYKKISSEFECKEIGEIVVKNKQNAINVYEVLATHNI